MKMNKFEVGISAILIAGTLSFGAQVIGILGQDHMTKKLYREVKNSPVIYRHTNGDDIEDRIQREIILGGRIGSILLPSRIKETILYGIDIEGQRLYLTEEQYNKIKK